MLTGPLCDWFDDKAFGFLLPIEFSVATDECYVLFIRV